MEIHRDITWYWNRLRAMTPAEIVVRVRHASQVRAWKKQTVWPTPAPAITFDDAWTLPDPKKQPRDQVDALCAAADRIVSGEYRLLNWPFRESELDWHRDPQLNRRAPLTYSLNLDYRDPDLVGNVKNIWEKNRHHHLSLLAAAYALTRKPVYAQEILRQLTAWESANPFLRGVNWTSPLELGVRLIAWVWIERLLRGAPEHEILFGAEGRLWPSIYRHQWMIRRLASCGSSANNHLIGEMAGLFIASTVWPVFEASAEWRTYARRRLEREIRKQTFKDGLNREQAFEYHLFSLDFFELTTLEAARSGMPMGRRWDEWIGRMRAAIPRLLDVAGNAPRYGDGDEGLALLLTPGGRVAQRDKAGAELLAHVLGSEPTGAPTSPEVGAGDFPHAGYYQLIEHEGAPDERRCLFDAGPLGYLSIAAHGHADALAFTLHVGGIPVLVDPGTGSYHADPMARAYFRSTRAHNTITVDELDQSEPGGVFMWTSHARTRRVERTAEGITAEHIGYRRLKSPVTHRRSARFIEGRLEVNDSLISRGEHLYEFRLHFAPWCRVDVQEKDIVVAWQGGGLRITRDPQLTYRMAQGEPEAGWYSRGFNLKEPAPTLIGTCMHTGPLHLNHTITIALDRP